MNLLSEHSHKYFNSSVINSLNIKRVFTVLDFLSYDIKFIEKSSTLTYKEILDIRKELLKKYSAAPENAFVCYQYILSHSAIIQTGVKDLDQLLGGGLFTGNIYEICGQPSSGKSLFCLTLIKNVALSMNDAITYYLDTKHDFQALKLKQMISCLGKEKVVEVMNSISVRRLKTQDELLNSLLELKEVVQNGSNVRLIIIDSLPPLYFQSNNHTDSNSFLNHIVNILRYLVIKFNVIVIVTNLITLWNEGDFKNKNSMKERIACGSYWYSVPNVRLKFKKEDRKCDITLTKSIRIIPKINHCLVEINEKGFI